MSDNEKAKRNEILQSAVSKLEIEKILLTSSDTYVRDGYAPDLDDESQYVIQNLASRVGIGRSEEGDQQAFKVLLGIRLIPKDRVEEAKTEEGAQEHTIVEVQAGMLAFYSASEALTSEEEEIFHQENVLFHVWPYWREYVQQMAWRMDAPYLKVKMLKNKRLK